MASWLLLGPADEAPKWLAEVALTPWQDKPTRAVAAAEEGHLRRLVYPVMHSDAHSGISYKEERGCSHRHALICHPHLGGQNIHFVATA